LGGDANSLEATIQEMLEFKREQFRRSLADTIAWCAAQFPEPNDLVISERRHRRTLVERADRLWKDAQTIANGGSIKRKIAEIAEWREARALWEQVRVSLGPLDDKLRSVSIKPTLPLDSLEDGVLWAEAVAEVVNRRRQLVDQIWQELRTTQEDGGRLLLYYTFENLADGAAQQSSNGFFDADNIPPWDTWVGFSEGILLSWVPALLIEAAQMGIDANPEGCIRWSN
jgi:hypothetical protein